MSKKNDNGFLTAWDRTKTSALWAAGYYATFSAMNYKIEQRYKANLRKQKREYHYHWNLSPEDRMIHELHYHRYIMNVDVNHGISVWLWTCFWENDTWDNFYEYLQKGIDDYPELDLKEEYKKIILSAFMPTYKENWMPPTIRRKPDYFWHLPAPSEECSEKAQELYKYYADAVEEQNEQKKNTPFHESEYKEALSEYIMFKMHPAKKYKFDPSKYSEDIVERIDGIGCTWDKK